MANWFDKLSKIAEQVVSVVEDTTAKTVKTYQEQGFNGIVEKTSTILDKTGDKLEKVGAVAAEKTQGYLKTLGEANKEVMSDVENNVGKGTTTAKIAGGLAATAYTAQTLALDLASVTKNAYQKFAQTQNQSSATQSMESLVAGISLEDVLEKIIDAKKVDNKWVTKNGTTYIVFEDSWYCPHTQIGDKNGITLTAYHLASITKLDYNNAVEHKELIKAAYDVLATSGLVEGPAQNIEEPEVQPEVQPKVAEKKAVRKTAQKTTTEKQKPLHAEVDAVVKANPVKVKASKTNQASKTNEVAKTDDLENTVSPSKKPARKTATKKVGAIVVDKKGITAVEATPEATKVTTPTVVTTKPVKKAPAKQSAKQTKAPQTKAPTAKKPDQETEQEDVQKTVAAKTSRKIKP